jgi:hypothetical protein
VQLTSLISPGAEIESPAYSVPHGGVLDDILDDGEAAEALMSGDLLPNGMWRALLAEPQAARAVGVKVPSLATGRVNGEGTRG